MIGQAKVPQDGKDAPVVAFCGAASPLTPVGSVGVGHRSSSACEPALSCPEVAPARSLHGGTCRGRVPTMAATAVRVPFSDATPAEIREVLLPEELPEFERQYRRALEVAAETFSLDELGKTLRSWRRIAWMTDSDPEAHRRMLHNVERTLRTGQSPPGSVPWNELKARLSL